MNRSARVTGRATVHIPVSRSPGPGLRSVASGVEPFAASREAPPQGIGTGQNWIHFGGAADPLWLLWIQPPGDEPSVWILIAGSCGSSGCVAFWDGRV